MYIKTLCFVLLLISTIAFVPSSVGFENVPVKSVRSTGTVHYSDDLEWVHTAGKSLVDSQGRKVVLNGVNFMGYEFGAWDNNAWQYGLHYEGDYVRIASWGFNVVRLPVAWKYIEPSPGVYDETYLANYVDHDVEWARKHGIYIIIAMWEYRWSAYFGGNGMPEWTCNGYPNTDVGRGQATTDFWLGKGTNGTEASTTNPSLMDRFIAMWRYVALRYRGNVAVLGYDLFNEPPISNYLVSPGLDAWQLSSILYPFYERLITEIRTVDPDHIIVYQPVRGIVVKYSKPLNYPNVVFSFHFYDLNDLYDGNTTVLRNAFFSQYWNLPSGNPLSTWNIPTFVGEFGCRLTTKLSWVRDILNIFSEFVPNWSYWVYWKADNYGYALLHSDGTEKEQLQYLKSTLPVH